MSHSDPVLFGATLDAMRLLPVLAVAVASVSSALAQTGEGPPPGARVILRGLQFGFDTAYLEPVSRGTLEAVAEEIQKREGTRMRIEGHTDSAGSEEYNRQLSLERAQAVKRILVGYGVAPDHLEAVGLGESQPIAPNLNEKGRTLNRRVELVVIE